MLVKLERYFQYPDLKRQTPNESLKWGNIDFTEEDIDECDYLVILDYPKKDIEIRVNSKNIIHVCLEPPNEISKYRQYGNSKASFIISQIKVTHPHFLSHGALPWHVDRNYDSLKACNVEHLSKDNTIGWITSNQKSSKGHKERMDFLSLIIDKPFMKIRGRGIEPINDKWSLLSGCKYAIAYENFNNDYYWTEKISDCFLSFTMPLYYGCNKISEFFPKDSFIQLDPKDKHIAVFLKELTHSKLWERSLPSIIEARNLILDQYQLFPFLHGHISNIEAKKDRAEKQIKSLISIKSGTRYFDNYPWHVVFQKEFAKAKRKFFFGNS